VSARLKEEYFKIVRPELKKDLGYANVMQVPRLEKIVVNMGVGDAIADARMIDAGMEELSSITGQKPSVRIARKSISNFKLRAGVKIACMVTLRGERMYEFADRFFNVAIPRIRDFRGVSPKSFDQFGNYTLGLREQTIFPELNIDKVTRVRGMNITFVVASSTTSEASIVLLTKLGMPFAH
jgi:large subunit ribosomal protein L5